MLKMPLVVLVLLVLALLIPQRPKHMFPTEVVFGKKSYGYRPMALVSV